jgi:hypothetical protein
MGIFGTIVALIIPWALGALALRRWVFTQGDGAVAACAGYGFFIGLVSAAILLGWQVKLGLPLTPWFLVGLAAVGVAILAWTLRGEFAVAWPAWSAFGASPMSRVLSLLLVLWLCLRAVTLLLAVLWQPLLPWDAWTTWALRAKVWVELGEWVPFVAPEVWLADVEGVSRTTPAWHYPETLSWISAWASAAAGGWNEQAANLPWVGAFLALMLGFYGQARLWGANVLTGLVFVWLLSSIPMLGAHVALAGYGDLWIASLLGLAFMAFLRWVQQHDRRQLAVMLLVLVLGWTLKTEAIVWSLAFVPAVIATWGSWRLCLTLIAAAVVGAGAFVLLGDGAIDLPWVGSFVFTPAGSWPTVLIQSFVFGSWHLFSYLLIAALMWAVIEVVRGRASAAERAATVWVLAGLLGFYVLFFWTGASEWAERGTALNRILLQFTPAFVFFVFTLWSARRADSVVTAD